MNKVFIFLSLVALASSAPKVNKLNFRNLYQEPLVEVNSKPNGRIINGQEAKPHSLPYQVFFELYSTVKGWYCGGALVSEKYIISAAHCSNDVVRGYVILGAHTPLDSEENHLQIQLTGDNFISHKDWDSAKYINDIAVIILPEPVTFNDYIKPVGLPALTDSDDDYIGAMATFSGWGLTNSSSTKPSPVLNYVNLEVIANSECEKFFGPLQDTKLCTSSDTESSVCRGDSGGPLVTDGVLIGITAFVVKDCPVEYPSGFTRITKFLDWIAKNTNNELF